MIEIAEIVLPVFGIIAIGYVAAWTRLVSDRVADGLSEFIFVIAMPALLFRTMVTNALPESIPWAYWLSYVGGLGTTWLLTHILVRRWFGAPPLEAVIAGLTVGQGNLVVAGIPLVLKAFGDSATIPIALLIAINLPLTMSVATLLLEGAGGASGKAIAKRLARAIVTHPILIGIFAGLIGNGLGVKLTGPVDVVIEALGRAGPPAALFALGMALRHYGIGERIGLTVFLTAMKLLLAPLLVYGLAVHVFNLPQTFASVAVLFAAMPVGVNVYLFAVRYKTGVPLTSAAIALSTGLAVVSSAFWLWVLGVG